MGITRERFLEKVEEIAQSNPSYKEGRDGSDGACDCIGLIIGAIRRAGGSWTGIHGSNYSARYEMRELLPVMDAGELNPGDAVYKARMPGQTGYDLPERYGADPDNRDYYHIGVVTAVEPLEITHCTGPGIVRDTKLGKWTYRGRLKKVDYDGTEGMETMVQTATVVADKVDYDGTSQEVGTMVQAATVVADSGDDVKMRSTPSQTDGLYWKVPVGDKVQVAYVEGEWAKVRHQGRTGYMMVEYLKMDAQEPTASGSSSESTGGELITVQRAALQAVYDALGSILQGG